MRLIKLVRGRKRLTYFILALVFVIGMHCCALTMKIRCVEPETYSKLAIDLKITPEYRYGYKWGWHGAILVKTPNVEGASPYVLEEEPPVKGDSEEPLPDGHSTDMDQVVELPPEDQSPGLPDRSIKVIMWDELALVLLKFILELALYIAILLYLFFGVRWIRTKLHVDQWKNIGQCLFMAAAWIVFWMLAFFPLGLYGYGYPIHSSWMGPGALVYSYFPSKLSTGSGLTISYRYVIDFLSLYPLMLLAFIASAYQYVPVIGSQIQISLTVMGSLFYGLGGIVYILRKNRTELWTALVRVFIITSSAFLLVIAPFPPWRQPQWVREFIDAIVFMIAKILFPWFCFLIFSHFFIASIRGKWS